MNFRTGITLSRLCRRILNANVNLLRGPTCQIATSHPTRRKQSERARRAEREFLSSSSDVYADTFGNLDKYETALDRIADDPEDVKEYLRKKAGQGKTVRTYIAEIKNHLKNYNYEKALHVLEVDMVNDYKPPIPAIYTVLIHYNADQGNLEEAYRLYTNFKRRGGKVNGAMYTLLFNACANCKNSMYALKKVEAIREYLNNDQNISMNITHYNVMLKAYGRHGDLPSCFKLMDEIIARRDKVRAITYCFLLQACLSDKNSGLRHALVTWRKMLQFRIRPGAYEFNILLRCIRECSFGDVELMNDLVQQILSQSTQYYKKKVLMEAGPDSRTVVNIPVPEEEALKVLLDKENNETSDGPDTDEKEMMEIESALLNSPEIDVTLRQEQEDDTEVSDQTRDPESEEVVEGLKEEERTMKSIPDSRLPNLIMPRPNVGSVIDFGSMTQPHERFLCFGGLSGFLRTMKRFGVKPNMKTFTLLLDLLPGGREKEDAVIRAAKAQGVVFDTAFFNVLLKRRCSQGENVNIQDVLKEMQRQEVSPDIITFGTLATACDTHEKGLELIECAHASGLRLNSITLGALLRHATSQSDLQYVKTIMNVAKEDDTVLSPKFLVTLNKFIEHEKRKQNESVKLSGES